MAIFGENAEVGYGSSSKQHSVTHTVPVLCAHPRSPHPPINISQAHRARPPGCCLCFSSHPHQTPPPPCSARSTTGPAPLAGESPRRRRAAAPPDLPSPRGRGPTIPGLPRLPPGLSVPAQDLRLTSRRGNPFYALVRLLRQLEGLERLEILFPLAREAGRLLNAIGDGSLALPQLQVLHLPELQGPLPAALVQHLRAGRLPRLLELETALNGDNAEALVDALEARGRLGLPPLRRIGPVGYPDVAELRRLWALLPSDRVSILDASDGARVAALGEHLLAAPEGGFPALRDLYVGGARMRWMLQEYMQQMFPGGGDLPRGGDDNPAGPRPVAALPGPGRGACAGAGETGARGVGR